MSLERCDFLATISVYCDVVLLDTIVLYRLIRISFIVATRGVRDDPPPISAGRLCSSQTPTATTAMADTTSSSDEGSVDPAGKLFDRAIFLRSLREADEAERGEAAAAAALKDASGLARRKDETGDEISNGGIRLLANGVRVLVYDDYLRDQRYYDDLKHSDCDFIDYGVRGGSQAMPGQMPLIIEQEKGMGKGGLCWDAAFVLGEYLARRHAVAIAAAPTKKTTLIELGGGTGLCGLFVAQALDHVHVTLTDLAALQPLLLRNVRRNFGVADDTLLDEYYGAARSDPRRPRQQPRCNVDASVLEWGDRAAEERHGTFDVVIGADVVASLYDPIQLARTIVRLCHATTVVYISFKERLSAIHRQFEAEMDRLFRETEMVRPESRNRNPDIRILVARCKL